MKVASAAATVLLSVAVSAGVAAGADFEWSSAGALDTVPTWGGDAGNWGDYFIGLVHNGSGSPIHLDQLGFPCSGASASWGIWLGATLPPDYSSPDFSGTFTPADTSGTTNPPTTYSYVDISGASIVIPDGADFWIGYSQPGLVGAVDPTSAVTYGWYASAWSLDSDFEHTTVLQVTGSVAVPVELQSFTVD